MSNRILEKEWWCLNDKHLDLPESLNKNRLHDMIDYI